MKTALAILLLSSTSAFAADECYQSPKHPSWTVTLTADPEKAPVIWKRGKKSTDLYWSSGGTDTGINVLTGEDPDKFYRYEYGDKTFTMDKVVYRLGCKA